MTVARKVAKNTFYNFLSLAVGNISGLFLAILLARILKPENFGIYSLAIVVANLAIALSTLGIDNAVVRYISFYHGKGDISALRSHFRHFFKVKATVTLLVALMLILFSNTLSDLFNNEKLTIPFVLAGIVVIFASLSNLFTSFLRGLQRFDFVFLRQSVYEISRWLFVVPLAIGFLAIGAVSGVVLAYISATLAVFFIVTRHYRELIFGESQGISEKVHSYMGFMTIASLSGIIYTYVDSIMIGYLIDSTYVGFYRAAYTPVFAIAGFASSLAGVLLPTFTQLSKKEIEAGLNRLNRYVSIIVFPMAVITAFFAPQIVHVLYGEDYAVSGEVMRILAFGMVANGFVYLSVILNAKERADLVAYISLSGMLMNIVLNYVLIPVLGISGAAIATVVSRFFVILSVIFALIRSINIDPGIQSILKPAISSIPVAMLLLTLQVPDNIVDGMLDVSVALITYLVFLVILGGISRNDLKYVMDLLRR